MATITFSFDNQKMIEVLQDAIRIYKNTGIKSEIISEFGSHGIPDYEDEKYCNEILSR